MRRSILIPAMVLAALWSAPALAQSRAQLGPLCTSEATPADQQIDACNKIIALKVFSGANLATVSTEPNRAIEAGSGLAAPTALGPGATLGAER
jgi:hypothetical protein